MCDSQFRIWFKALCSLTGRRIEWPQLMRKMLADEISYLKTRGEPYKGPRIFIDRYEIARQHASDPNQNDEEQLAYKLYRCINEKNAGSVCVDGEDVWFFMCQVPNQGSHPKRCADLLGLRLDGSLVVFECKVANNHDNTPLFALLEGMDYLGHLLIDQNMERLKQGFDAWRRKQKENDDACRIQRSFDGVDIKENARHSVLVLAPQSYYKFHREDSKHRKQDWELLSDRSWPDDRLQVRMDFAVTDYSAKPCDLLPL